MFSFGHLSFYICICFEFRYSVFVFFTALSITMELKQHLKLSQQLVMTPQLQQAIKLLQLSRIELSDVIQQEIDENPVLDESLGSDENEKTVKDDLSTKSSEDKTTENDQKSDFDWRDYVESTMNPSRGASYKYDREEIEPIITEKATLTDHLLWQLRLHDFNEKEIETGEYIIRNIDKDGYLRATLEEIALSTGFDLKSVDDVHKKIQEFDPVGVASIDLQSCLLKQLSVLPCCNKLIKDILSLHMKDLEKRRYQAIARGLKVSLKEVIDACEIIANMEPRPGRVFSDKEPQYITPDIYVFKLEGEYIVVLNEDGQPRLRVSAFYKNILSGDSVKTDKAKEYIQEKLRSAVWLIKSIYHRQTTIVKVMKSIIKFQKDFFDYGTANLKPLVLRDVAEDIGMHESNISRVTTNKYVHTPHGIYELKYFFNSGLSSDNGDIIASESVKNLMKELIDKEDVFKPYSDQELAETLQKKGINIARRTVTKYRDILGVLSSSKRKKHI